MTEPVTPHLRALASVLLLAVLTACRGNSPLPAEPTSLATPRGTIVQTSPVTGGGPVGPEGGGPLTPGTDYPPTDGGEVTLYRDESCLRFTLDTTGLPPGAFDLWMVIFNYPDRCVGPQFEGLGNRCGTRDYPNPPFRDLFNLSPSQPTEGWRDGTVVGADGTASFAGGICIGERFGEPVYQHLFGPGLLDPLRSEVFFSLLYHGPASDDPEVRYWQTHGGLASCTKDANGYVWPTGQVVCPILQNAFFPAPPEHAP